MAQSRGAWIKRDDEDDLIRDDEIGQGGVSSGDKSSSLTTALDISMTASLRQVQDQPNVVYTSQWAALFIIVNMTVGLGFLAIPFTMQTTGIVGSMIIQLLILGVIIVTCIMCIELAVKSKAGSYHEIIEKHCSRPIYMFTQVSILLVEFGGAAAYIVAVGDQSDRLFASLYGPTFCNTWYMNRVFIMTILTVLGIEVLASARTVDFLKYGSSLGLLSIGFIFYVVASTFKSIPKIPDDVNYYPRSWGDVAFILPVLCLAFRCHLTLVPTIATIPGRQKRKTFITITIAMVVAMLIYSTVSVLAVLTFGAHVEKDLTENFSGTGWVTLTTIIIVPIKVVLTLPASYLPARFCLIDVLTGFFPSFGSRSETFKRISVTVLFFNLSLLTAILMPNILVAVNMLGVLSVAFIFILPSMAYLNLVKENRLEKQRGEGGERDIPLYTSKDKIKRIGSYTLLVLGFFMTIIVMYESIRGIMNSCPSSEGLLLRRPPQSLQIEKL